MVKIDLGCGKNKRDGFLGVDARMFDGVDRYCDLSQTPWVFAKIVESNEPPPSAPGRIVSQGGEGWRWNVLGAEPIEANSVDEVHCSHFVEHLTPAGRIAFINELHRVLKVGGSAAIITPHWASARAYGDLTHQWPPVSEFWYYYLNAEWRKVNAPHNDGYTCDFDATWGYALHPSVALRNQDYQSHAVQFFKEAAQDLHATVTKRG